MTKISHRKNKNHVTFNCQCIALLVDWKLHHISCRFIRQIGQSLQPIFDMLVLLIFFMLMFAILGKWSCGMV